jgi:hypothetical protein
MSGLFSKVAESKVSKTGNFFLAREDGGPARYIVQITMCKSQTSKASGKVFAVIEARVKASSTPRVQIGDERSQLIDMTNVMGPINVKKFVAAALGIDPFGKDDDVTMGIIREGSALLGRPANVEAICEWIFSDGNPLGEAELELGLVCTTVKTKKTHADFTVHDWHPGADFTI